MEQYPALASDILFQLPDKCKVIYGQQNDEYRSLKTESELFKKFTELLNELEEYNPEIEYTEDTFPEKQWAFRMDLYNDYQLSPCSNNETDLLIISECIQEQRTEMISFLQLNVTQN